MPRWTYHVESNSPVPNVPEFVMFGSDEIRRALPLFEHEHPGCYEFVLVERGKASWALGDHIYETQAGDVFYSRPGEKHRGGFNVIEPCKFWWVIVNAPHHEGWLGLPQDESRAFEHALTQLPRVVPIGLPPVDSFKKLQQALKDEEHTLRSTIVRHALIDLLLRITRPITSTRSIADDLLEQFDRIIARLNQEPEWRPTVEALAACAGISESHFYRTFQDYTGEPPMTFIERHRVKIACRLLTDTPDTITAIAHQLGYPSSQHFATVFKRFVGVTPTAWRKSSSRPLA